MCKQVCVYVRAHVYVCESMCVHMCVSFDSHQEGRHNSTQQPSREASTQHMTAMRPNLEGLHVGDEGKALHLGPHSGGLFRGPQLGQHTLLLPHHVLCHGSMLLGRRRYNTKTKWHEKGKGDD